MQEAVPDQSLCLWSTHGPSEFTINTCGHILEEAHNVC